MMTKALSVDHQQPQKRQRYLTGLLNSLLDEELYILGRYNGFYFRYSDGTTSKSLKLIQNIHNHRVADITQYVRDFGGEALRDSQPERHMHFFSSLTEFDAQRYLDELYRIEDDLVSCYANFFDKDFPEPLHSFLQANARQQKWITTQRSVFDATLALPH